MEKSGLYSMTVLTFCFGQPVSLNFVCSIYCNLLSILAAISIVVSQKSLPFMVRQTNVFLRALETIIR